jgi:hypothetical protein
LTAHKIHWFEFGENLLQFGSMKEVVWADEIGDTLLTKIPDKYGWLFPITQSPLDN